MELLKQRILRDGQVKEGGVLKVDSFLNHQMDVTLLNEIGREFRRRFDGADITKIVTIEASGIGIACLTAQYFDVPVVFAKKTKTNNIYSDVYTSTVESYTHKRSYEIVVSKEFLLPEDRVLIIDDFLAKGSAICALSDLIESAGAHTVGAGIVIEKSYQSGARLVRERGIRLESLARIESMSVSDGVKFVAD